MNREEGAAVASKTDAQRDAEKRAAAHQKALADQPAGYLEPVFDEPDVGASPRVLVATSPRSLADLEGERIPVGPVHPNGQPVDPKPLETTIDPFVVEANKDAEYAPLSKAADTAGTKASK